MKKKKTTRYKISKKKKIEVTGLLLCALGLFAGFSIYLPMNSTGAIGKVLKQVIMGMFGLAGYIIPAIILLIGFFVIISYRKVLNKFRIFLTSMIVILSFALLHLLYFSYMDSTSFTAFLKSSYRAGAAEGCRGGGAVIAPVTYAAYALFGIPGSYVLFISLLIADVLMLTNLSLKKLVLGIYMKLKSSRRHATKQRDENTEKKSKPFIGEVIPTEETYDSTVNLQPIQDAFREKNMDAVPDMEQSIKIIGFDKENIEADKSGQEAITNSKAGKKESIPDEISTIDPIKIKQETLPYMMPPISLLREPVLRKEGAARERIVLNNARLLEETLDSFGVSAKVVQVSRGPVITRYELQPAPGVRTNRIKNLSDDIALNLAAQGVRIEAPIPGKAAIGVEVPNKDIVPVMLREVMESDVFESHPSKIAFALGKDIAGKNIIADIAKMPHLLIAGATGSGKSVCINTLIVSILYKATPDEVKLIMIDPKVVELSSYNGIPHLLIPVVTDPKKAAGALNWAVQEMLNRYKLFADKGVRDMERYNEQLNEEGEPPLPQIIVIIDELADLMMVAPNDVEDAICRLAQMARAAGIHLVIATQRPSVDVITGVIKANIPSRIAFAVSSQTDSRTILDMGGAEKLLGKGDMLYFPTGFSKPIRVQGSYITEKEVEKVVACIKNQNEPPEYNMDVLEEIAAEVEGGQSADDYDELLPEAIETVIDAGQASISMLQRRLRVGYARAARMIDEMERRGLISGFNGSKTRNVLITREEYEKEFKD
jgi:S-DNA-T family DNA segregation ATPase FtsK/SpoIIIE